MKDNNDHIMSALKILISLGLPRAQQNERSALCLLALLNLTPGKKWVKAEDPLIGITPIMDWARMSRPLLTIAALSSWIQNMPRLTIIAGLSITTWATTSRR